jgi:hypothetical protein
VSSTIRVLVLMIATEFWDGIVAYISGSAGLMTNEEAGKLYCATISPKAASALGAQASKSAMPDAFGAILRRIKDNQGTRDFFMVVI